MKWLEHIPIIGAFLASTAVDTTGNGTLEMLINVGMVILVYYGVFRIIVKLSYKLLTGRELQITKGLLDYLTEFTRPVKVTNLAENAGELENEDKIVDAVGKRLTEKIKLAKTPRTNKMKEKLKNAIAYCKANPKTFLGLFAVGLFAVDLCLGTFFDIQIMKEVIAKINDVVPLPANIETAISAMLITALGYFGISGVKGEGFETVEAHAVRKEAELEKAKLDEAAAKLDKSVQTVIKKAEELGADPIVYAMNNGVGQKVIDKIKEQKQ